MSTATVNAYGRILRARWRWVAWGVALAAIAVALLLILWPPVYRTHTTVFVRTPGDVSQAQDGGDQYAQLRADTYATLARSNTLASRVIADLGLSMSPERLAGRIQAKRVGRTALFQITLGAPTADEARRAAEVLVNELSAEVDALETVPGTLIPRAQLVVVDPPGEARRVVAWGAPVYFVVIGALLAGAALGATGAVLREILSTTSQSEREDA